jgi:hypothetical protein
MQLDGSIAWRTLMHSLPIVALVGLLWPGQSVAQTWVRDSNSVRLAWGTANVLVRADTSAGVQVWAETSRLFQNTPTRAFAARFDPDSTAAWVSSAEALISTTTAPADTEVTRLQTRPLRGTDGSQIVLVRRRRGTKWESHTRIFFLNREGRLPWYIEAPKADADTFVKVLFAQSAVSHWRPQQPADPLEPNPIEPSQCPLPLPGNPRPRFPSGHNAGSGGEVWVSFVVRPDAHRIRRVSGST